MSTSITQEQNTAQAVPGSFDRLKALSTATEHMGLVQRGGFDHYFLGSLAALVTDEIWNEAMKTALRCAERMRKFTIDDAREMGGFDHDTEEGPRTASDFGGGR